MAWDRSVGQLAAREYDGGKILLAPGGLGKAQFGVQTQHLIENLDGIDVVVCTGTCGRLSKDLTVGDVVVGTQTVEHDFNRGMSLIKLPLPTFEGDGSLIEEAERLLPIVATCPAKSASAASPAATKALPARSASVRLSKAQARSLSPGRVPAAHAQPSSPASHSSKFAAFLTAQAKNAFEEFLGEHPHRHPQRSRRSPRDSRPALTKHRQYHRRAHQPQRHRRD